VETIAVVTAAYTILRTVLSNIIVLKLVRLTVGSTYEAAGEMAGKFFKYPSARIVSGKSGVAANHLLITLLDNVACLALSLGNSLANVSRIVSCPNPDLRSSMARACSSSVYGERLMPYRFM
jgi:hypothetical protein